MPCVSQLLELYKLMLSRNRQKMKNVLWWKRGEWPDTVVKKTIVVTELKLIRLNVGHFVRNPIVFFDIVKRSKSPISPSDIQLILISEIVNMGDYTQRISKIHQRQDIGGRLSLVSNL